MTGRYDRQRGVLDPERLAHCAIDVAGVGAVGRQVVIQLISAGARNVNIFDHDTIEEINLGPQGWPPCEVGSRKVTAITDFLERYYNDEEIGLTPWPVRYPRLREPQVLFLCVDGIDTRRRIFEHTPPETLILDSRVVADTIHILASYTCEERERYQHTFFRPEEAFQGTCTTRMSIHIANIAAGLLMQQLSKYMRSMPLDTHTVFNLLAMECYNK